MTKLYFDLDDRDQICAVSANWNDVAIEQNGSSLLSESIIGQNVWPFIAGAGTQEFFAAIFKKVRSSNQSVNMPYRCDAPLLKRFFVMEISRQSNGTVRVSHIQIDDSDIPFSVIHMSDLEPDMVCSICLSIHRQGEWNDYYFSPRGTIDPDSFTVCPKCRESAEV